MAVWTSPDWSLPIETTLYTDVLDYIDFRLDDVATGLVDTLSKTYTNLPVNTIRWNSTSNKWEKWSGTAWGNLTTTYAISISGTSSNITGTVLAANGGTGFSSYTIGDILTANTSTTLSKISAVAVGKVLISGGVATQPSWGSLDLETHTTGTLPVSKGGTGVTTITGLLYGNGTSDISSASSYIGIDTVTSLVSLAGDIKIGGNDIQSSSGTVAITLSGANATIAGTLNCGAITSSGDITSSSDIRLKTNISTIDKALDKVLNLRGVYFDMKDTTHVGVIAQEVEKVLPEVVSNANTYKSVAYGNIVGLLIEAIKELNTKVERLENAG